MDITPIIAEIEKNIDEILKVDYTYTGTVDVPTASNKELSYERGEEKTGKKITTCVLYADIRDSMVLNRDLSEKRMAQLYTAFTKAVIKIARHHGGHTRNIIGDRVMIVFPSHQCFTNAVKCAISINHIAKTVISKKFALPNFRCGVGVDHGELKVIKVGVARLGHEQNPNRGLVWTSKAANIASRLTDMGGKKIIEQHIQVVKELRVSLGRPSGTGMRLVPKYIIPIANDGSILPERVTMSQSKFVDSIQVGSGGEMRIDGTKVISFSKVPVEYEYPTILITNRVHQGIKTEADKSLMADISKWKYQSQPIKDVTGSVYGMR